MSFTLAISEIYSVRKANCLYCLPYHCSRYVWNSNGNVKIWHQQAKIDTQSFKIPSVKFQTVHINIIDRNLPIKIPNNPYISLYRYVITCVLLAPHFGQRFNQYLRSLPKSVSWVFVNADIIRFDVPLHVITGRCTHFENEIFPNC